MAAGDSIISICNSALILLGETPITALTDANKRAAVCNIRYDPVRRAELRRHPYNCADRQATLAASSIAPITAFNLAFPLPADCLRLLDLPDLEDKEAYEVQNLLGAGPCVLVNYYDEGGALDILYTFDLKDPTQFDALFTDALAYALAFDICMTLTQSQTTKNRIAADLQDKRGTAMLVSSQENSPPELDTDVLLRVRQ